MVQHLSGLCQPQQFHCSADSATVSSLREQTPTTISSIAANAGNIHFSYGYQTPDCNIKQAHVFESFRAFPASLYCHLSSTSNRQDSPATSSIIVEPRQPSLRFTLRCYQFTSRANVGSLFNRCTVNPNSIVVAGNSACPHCDMLCQICIANKGEMVNSTV